MVEKRSSTATAVLAAYHELVEKFENPTCSCLAELQGAAEYLLDKIKEARRRGVDSVLPAESSSQSKIVRIRKSPRG